MAIANHFHSSLQRRFDRLSSVEQAAQWVSFVDAIDAGEVGWHPYYVVLAPMYAAGVTPFDPEPLESREIDVFSIEGGAYLEALTEAAAA